MGPAHLGAQAMGPRWSPGSRDSVVSRAPSPREHGTRARNTPLSFSVTKIPELCVTSASACLS